VGIPLISNLIVKKIRIHFINIYELVKQIKNVNILSDNNRVIIRAFISVVRHDLHRMTTFILWLIRDILYPIDLFVLVDTIMLLS